MFTTFHQYPSRLGTRWVHRYYRNVKYLIHKFNIYPSNLHRFNDFVSFDWTASCLSINIYYCSLMATPHLKSKLIWLRIYINGNDGWDVKGNDSQKKLNRSNHIISIKSYWRFVEIHLKIDRIHGNHCIQIGILPFCVPSNLVKNLYHKLLLQTEFMLFF